MSGIGGVQVTSLHHDPIGVNNRSFGVEFSNIKEIILLNYYFLSYDIGGGLRHWQEYHKWSLTICDGCFDTLKSSKMRSKASDKRCC